MLAFTLSTASELRSSRSTFPSRPTLRARSLFASSARKRQRASRPAPAVAAAARMTLHNVVIAGGSGFIGTALTQRLLQQGTNVTILSRSHNTRVPAGAKRCVWNPQLQQDVRNWQQQLSNADAVFNLGGHTVLCRWDAPAKQRIEQSRLLCTQRLGEAIRALPAQNRPRALVSSSAVGFYGAYEHDTAPFDEGARAAHDFLAQLCVKWERAAADALREVAQTRLVLVRTGVVLGRDGGALQRMLPAFRMFAGGAVGSGNQLVSWIHIHDLVNIYIQAASDESMSGAYNATAPNAVSMDDMARSLARALRRPCALRVPALALRALYGQGSDVVLKGQRVVPRRLLEETSFAFDYEHIDAAMDAVAAAL